MATGADLPAAQELNRRNPFTGNEETIAVGRSLYFKYGCNMCHGDGGGGGGGMGPPLINDDWVYGSDDETLFNLVRNGSLALGGPSKARSNSDRRTCRRLGRT